MSAELQGALMIMRTPAVLIAALVGACVLLAGCTSGSGVNTETLDAATTTPAASSPASASSSLSSGSQSPTLASPSSSAGSDIGLPAGEATDRAAVESQWVKSWDVYLKIARTPAADRKALIATVAVNPTKTNMLTDAGKFDSQGLETYGALGHRISWPKPIAGGTSAVIDDCQDRSQSGAFKTATGSKVTVGIPRDHYQGSLVRGADGVWRVAQVFYLKDEPC